MSPEERLVAAAVILRDAAEELAAQRAAEAEAELPSAA